MSSHLDDEQEALLGSSIPSVNSNKNTRSCWNRALEVPFLSRNTTYKHFNIVICVFCLQFLINFSRYVIEVPLVRLFEITICNRYYQDIILEEKLCKIPSIQAQLTTIIGWRIFFDALPALLTAIFYGRLADSHGRRLILFLSCFGSLCSISWIVFVCYTSYALPLKLVWASSGFLLLGGGQRVAKSMVFVILADILEQPERTRYMYMLASIPHITTMIAPLFANLFMSIDIWIPFAIAMGCLVLGFLVILVLPESLSSDMRYSYGVSSPGSTSPLLNGDERDPSEIRSEQISTAHSLPTKKNDDDMWSKVFADIISMVRVPGMLFCLGLFFTRPIALLSRTFVYQHSSESFGWPMSRTTWLRFSEAVSSSLATLVLLPLLSAYFDQKDHHAKRYELNVIRISLFIAAIGFAVVWQSRDNWMMLAGLFVCGLGEGFEPSLKGLATSLSEKSSNAQLLTLVAVLEVIARLIGGPLMAWLFSIGRGGQEYGSDGLCFLASAVIFLLLAIAACLAKVQR